MKTREQKIQELESQLAELEYRPSTKIFAKGGTLDVLTVEDEYGDLPCITTNSVSLNPHRARQMAKLLIQWAGYLMHDPTPKPLGDDCIRELYSNKDLRVETLEVDGKREIEIYSGGNHCATLSLRQVDQLLVTLLDLRFKM